VSRYRSVYWDPEGTRYGIPTYPWRMAPAGLATRRQLAADGLRPGGQPVAAQVMWRSRHRGPRSVQVAYLYRVEAARAEAHPDACAGGRARQGDGRAPPLPGVRAGCRVRHPAPLGGVPAVPGPDGRGSRMSTVYLLHFSAPYRHARHYTGWTDDLPARLAMHAAGHGARLIAVARAAGITFTLARTRPGSRADERAIKNAGGAVRYCPLCTPHPLNGRWTPDTTRRA
jgi:predicted GIY-YIG superfamily endonuclease